jgi:hypothetical protein
MVLAHFLGQMANCSEQSRAFAQQVAEAKALSQSVIKNRGVASQPESHA